MSSCVVNDFFTAILYDRCEDKYVYMFTLLQNLLLSEKIGVFIRSVQVLEEVHKENIFHGNINEYTFLFDPANRDDTRMINFEFGGIPGSKLVERLFPNKAREFAAGKTRSNRHSFAEDVWDFTFLFINTLKIDIDKNLYKDIPLNKEDPNHKKLISYVSYTTAAHTKSDLSRSKNMMFSIVASGLQPDPKERKTTNLFVKELQVLKALVLEEEDIERKRAADKINRKKFL